MSVWKMDGVDDKVVVVVVVAKKRKLVFEDIKSSHQRRC